MQLKKNLILFLLTSFLVLLMAGCPTPPPPTTKLMITTESPLSDATQGKPYSVTLQAIGGGYPFTWSSSELPGGLTLNPKTGMLSGTPTTTGKFKFKVTVTNSSKPPQKDTKEFQLTIISPPDGGPKITEPASLPKGEQGKPYPSTTVKATGGKPPLTWSATGLPAGLSIDAQSGVIGGTPMSAGNNLPVSVKVADSASPARSDTRSFQLTIIVPPPEGPKITEPASLPQGEQGKPYPNTTVKATGGTPPLSWSATGLPAGLSINAQSGVIGGTPTSAGNNLPVSVKVADSATPARSDTRSFQLTIVPQQCATHIVRMEGFQFNPANLPIKACETVTWEHHQGQIPHTVTSGEFGAADAGSVFDSRGGDPNARMREPNKFSHTFNDVGTFPYHCVVHGGAGGMNGTITVNP